MSPSASPRTTASTDTPNGSGGDARHRIAPVVPPRSFAEVIALWPSAAELAAVLDVEAVTDLATQHLGATPFLRIGQAPKRLLVYRTDTPFAGRKRAPLEVLAHGQQFVAYAVHPGTGQRPPF